MPEPIPIAINKGNDALPFSPGGVVSAITGGVSNILTTSMQNKANAREANLNRKWQVSQATTAWDRQMDASNTSHQREMADMRLAGLNPILSAGGGGASTPSAATGGGAQARMEKAEPVREAQAAAASAMDIKNQAQQNKLLKETTKKTQEEAANIRLQQTVNVATANQVRINNQQQTMKLIELANQADIRGSKTGKGLAWIKELTNALGFGSSVSATSSGRR